MYIKAHYPLRQVEIEEGDKMMLCGEESQGYTVYECTNDQCLHQRFVPFTCKSRICSSCGKKHADVWAATVEMRLFAVMHRHIVFTLPSQLRPLLLANRESWKVVFNAAFETLSDVMKGDAVPGALLVFHSYGKDMKFNPHVHCIVTEGGIAGSRFVETNYFPYEVLRKKWQYHVLTALKQHFRENPPKMRQAMLCEECLKQSTDTDEIIDSLFKEYSDGFYVRAKDRVDPKRGNLVRYIGRYVRHPAISEFRIEEDDTEKNDVTFWYEDDDKKRHHVTLHAHDFIRLLISHVPDRNFKMVRWFGIYSRKRWRKDRLLMRFTGKYNIEKERYLQQRISHIIAIKCDFCGCVMRKIGTSFNPPT